MTVKVTKDALNLREKLSELDKPSGIAGQDILKADTPQEVFNYIGAGRRNLIINGAMQVAQRGTSFNTSGTGAFAYLVDRFAANDGACGTSTITQENDGVAGVSEYSLKYAATSNATNTASEDCWIRYVVETKDITNLNLKDSANSLTLSFWVKSSQTGQTSVAVTDGQYANRYIATYTVSSANTWQKVTVNVPSPSSFNYSGDYGLRVYWDLGAASNYIGTPNVWGTGVDWAVSGNFRIAGVSGEYLQITGVQLEVGSVATPFERRSYGEELALCQRYYQQPVNGTDQMFGMTSYYSSTIVLGCFDHPVEMRAVPSLSYSGEFSIRKSAGDDQFTTMSSYKSTARTTGYINNSEVSGTEGHCLATHTHSTNGGKITLDAEL